MDSLETAVRHHSGIAVDRIPFWVGLLHHLAPRTVAEVGVWRGDFAAAMLAGCESIARYDLIDPWRHLPDWNKPANIEDATFEQHLAATLAKTEFAATRRRVLRGRTTEVADQIVDANLDFAYIDGDHTLRGITIDLLTMWPKVKPGGFIGGDDLWPTIWQHEARFEPTLVFPFVLHFAEAMGARLFALPHAQFLLQKNLVNPGSARGFTFTDLTGRYGDPSLRRQFLAAPMPTPVSER
ncbi:MAG: class I SAM-dependent methyltransferase [Planctomycetes bacterium]|nr:class I SAM-dependent methyltransferase [Planctomycetota bacterium]